MVLTTEKADGIYSSAFSAKKKTMNKYLILKNTVANGKKLEAGDVVELAESDGNSLIGYNKAELTTADAKKKSSNRSVGLKKSSKKLKKTSE